MLPSQGPRETLYRNTYNERGHGGGGTHAHVPSAPAHVRGDVREPLSRGTFNQRVGHPQTSSSFTSVPQPVYPALHPHNVGYQGSSTNHIIHVRGTPTAGDRRVTALFFAIILSVTIAAAMNFSSLGIGVAFFVGGLIITRANERERLNQEVQ